MVEKDCDPVITKPVCPCSKKVNVTIENADGTKTVVEKIIGGYYKNVIYEVNYNGKMHKELHRECVDTCERWEPDKDLTEDVRKIFEEEKCYMCANGTIDCEPPLAYDPISKTCVPPGGDGGCPDGTIVWI